MNLAMPVAEPSQSALRSGAATLCLLVLSGGCLIASGVLTDVLPELGRIA